MDAKPKYACPQCGHTEFITSSNSYDRYLASNDELCWQSTEVSDQELQLYCRDCGERAPSEFEEVVQ